MKNEEHKDGGCGCGCSHSHNHSHHHPHQHGNGWLKNLRMFIPEILSAVLMIVTLCIHWGSETIGFFAYIVALLPVGLPILSSTFKEWSHGDIFNEFTLMVLACAGAFAIGEYPEGVAILLFYSFGEKLEDIVSGDVRSQIKNLLGKMPKKATVLRDEKRIETAPEEVNPGETIAVRPGEAVALDGILKNDGGLDFNTAAITGESLPRFFAAGEEINSGFIPVDREALVEVTREFSDSSLSRIMSMIEDASAHRAPSEKILRKITRWYTPIVFTAAVLLFVIPWIVGMGDTGFEFHWNVWLRRSLVFLVCSCPCALIVSIPLTYFSSIGIASKRGILFKGHDSLDTLRKVDTILFDKTGTITSGKFGIKEIKAFGNLSEESMLAISAAVEMSSTHPLAEAIVEEARNRNLDIPKADDIKIENHGISAVIDGEEILLGSRLMMKSHKIDTGAHKADSTAVYMAKGGKLTGVVTFEDLVKQGSVDAIGSLHKDGISHLGILSGDSNEAVESARAATDADYAYGELMPKDKQRIIREKRQEGYVVAFAGDGVNDAPALATADVGIAMGKLGTDMAIESAGMVIAGDDLRKIKEGLDISRRVKSVIIENVTFAFGVKLTVMILGAFGIASLWAAVFADTGVTVVTVIWTLLRLKIWELRK